MSVKLILSHFCEAHGPRVLFCTESKSRAQLNVTEAASRLRDTQNQRGGSCSACTSVDHMGFISEEEDCVGDQTAQIQSSFNQLVYKSSQYPDSADDFSHVRQACVKSLSNEVSIGRESCIFFGDSKNGYTLSLVFNLNDSKARGLQRLYSLLAWTRDRYFLINYWSFFEENFKVVINGLVRMAEEVYQNENKKEVAHQTFQRARLVTARNLPTLVNCDDVFQRLHQQFTWILKNLSSYFVEMSVPDWMRITNEDAEVSKEMQKDSFNDAVETTTINSNESPQQKEGGNSSTLLLPLRAVYQLLGGNYFIIVCLHTLIGNQVIVRGNNSDFVAAIVNTLAKLIPLGCCRVKTGAKQYYEAYEYNLVGLIDSSVQLPEHVQHSDMFVLLDVIGEGLELSLYKFEVTSNFFFDREKLPQILIKLEKILVNSHDFGSSEVIGYYCSLKEEMMGKVETFYQFTKLSTHHKDSKVKLQTCFKLLQASDNELEQMLLRFWVNGLSTRFKKNQIRYLKELQMSE